MLNRRSAFNLGLWGSASALLSWPGRPHAQTSTTLRRVTTPFLDKLPLPPNRAQSSEAPRPCPSAISTQKPGSTSTPTRSRARQRSIASSPRCAPSSFIRNCPPPRSGATATATPISVHPGISRSGRRSSVSWPTTPSAARSCAMSTTCLRSRSTAASANRAPRSICMAATTRRDSTASRPTLRWPTTRHSM